MNGACLEEQLTHLLKTKFSVKRFSVMCAKNYFYDVKNIIDKFELMEE